MSAALTRLRPARAQGHRHLLTGSALLVVGAAIQALSGALFWFIAARLDVEADVGAAAKLNTSVLFVTYLAGLGLPVSLARYAAGRDRDSDVTFTWGVVATVAAALVLAAVYIVVIPSDAVDVLSQTNRLLGPLAFAVIVAGSALSLIADVRCMTARRWNLVLVRITAVGLLRFPLLFVLRGGEDRAFWLFVWAAGPVALTGSVAALYSARVAGGRHGLRPRPGSAGAAIRYSAVNYVSTLAYQAPYFALPVIVLANVSARSYASFNVAWGIVAVAFYVPSAIGQALLAEGGRDGAHLRAQVGLALLLALGLMAVGSLASFAGSTLVERVYGSGYHQAARVLPVMMAAGVPWAITSLLLSEVRILHRHAATVVITVVLTVAVVVPALIAVPRDGVDGASAAWFIGNLVAGAVAIVTAAISRHRSRRADPALDEPATAADAAEVGITLAEPTV
ncbi:MAG: hypothetical protein HYX34_00250 [Actinobacteria bacterium]|nr:hypothetical protein [Actinomycetota bacterium]